ncbi:helix-turn-helix domain-containing protein [Aeoliella sp. SH292]|uniref:helix-turn-helix domain-containing protein n=1 Tax=Aeoliella sp. SH292 TaxID=3454464 RepID=UPI003F98FC7D
MPQSKLKPKSKSSHVSTSATLWDDLGFSAEEAAVMELKLSLHNEIMKVVERSHLRARDLERVLDISQPRASELMNGKISHMTADRLTKYLHRLGRSVKVTTKKTEPAASLR